MRTFGDINKDVVTLENYLLTVPHGSMLSWEHIQHTTKVVMDDEGKQRFRQAMRRRKREYAAIKGYGIKLADAASTMGLIDIKIKRIGKAVTRGDKTQRNLQQQFFNSLTTAEQRQLLLVGAGFAAIKLAVSESQRLRKFQGDASSAPVLSIPLPIF